MLLQTIGYGRSPGFAAELLGSLGYGQQPSDERRMVNTPPRSSELALSGVEWIVNEDCPLWLTGEDNANKNRVKLKTADFAA